LYVIRCGGQADAYPAGEQHDAGGGARQDLPPAPATVRRGAPVQQVDPFLSLIMHWNGTRWEVVPSPNPEETISIALNCVAAVSRDNIWAVGNANYSSTLIVHWNGKAWS
jgi:hypothetical protein